jgi:hypothetical protein
MTSSDPRAAALLDAFRRQRALAPPQRRAIWSQIEATLDADEPAATHETRAARSARVPIGWIAATALAAGIVLGIALAPHAAALVDATTNPTEAADVEVSPTPVYGSIDREGRATRPVQAAVPPGPEPTTSTEAATVAPASPRAPVRSPRSSDTVDPATAIVDVDVDDTDALVIESALLRRAHRALRAGDPDGAIAILDAHAEAFPSGQMLEDRLTLRIEALCAAGNRSQARAEATAMRRRFPGASVDACVEARSNAPDTDR